MQIHPIDEIIHRFKGLNLNESSDELQKQEQNAIVPYKGDGAVVPYEGFEHIKKRRPRPKVDLDQETNRIWNLLMGKEGGEGLEETNKEKEKWWENERKVFGCTLFKVHYPYVLNLKSYLLQRPPQSNVIRLTCIFTIQQNNPFKRVLVVTTYS